MLEMRVAVTVPSMLATNTGTQTAARRGARVRIGGMSLTWSSSPLSAGRLASFLSLW